MIRIQRYFFLMMVLLMAALASACAPLIAPVTTPSAEPTPIVVVETAAPAETPTVEATAVPAGGELFTNAPHGYQFSLPPGYEVHKPVPNSTNFLARESNGTMWLSGSIVVEPAAGRSVGEIVEGLKSTSLSNNADQPGTELVLDGERALVFDRVAAQDLMQVLYVVHEDRLYTMMFMPQDENQPEAFALMETLYKAITETFQFIPVEAAPANPLGGKLVAEMDVFLNLLQQGFTGRDAVALQSLMANGFSVGLWGDTTSGDTLAPSAAVEQILSEYAPEGAQLTFDPNHEVITRFYADGLTSYAGEELIPVHVSGWGAGGAGEAIFFIARRADGSLYWEGMLTAPDGFGE